MGGMMTEFSEVKIEVFVPDGYVDRVRLALAEAGAGRLGNYDHCCSITEVRGYWRPLEGANPYQGEIGRVEEGREYKLEVNCPAERVTAALQAIRRVHPYEEPLINVIPLSNHLY